MVQLYLHYCPWNANEIRVESDAFRDDEARLNRIIERVAGSAATSGRIFYHAQGRISGIALLRDAVRRLSALPHVRRVTVQTNLAWDVASFLPTVDVNKLALWTTYHPTEVDAFGLEALHVKWEALRSAGVRFSVGIVGTRDNLDAMDAAACADCRPNVYLWVNAYKREGAYYTSARRPQRIRTIDPYFDLNDQIFPESPVSRCTAGSHAVYLDDEGDLRRCFFVGKVIGNLFRDGWQTLPAPTSCPIATCHCYVGHMHVVELDISGSRPAITLPFVFHDEPED
jgi:hypothetical protein